MKVKRQMQVYELSEREKTILRFVIHQFILTASPVGSRNIAKKYSIGLSPATIRNIMSDLEEDGLLEHPHTSAGRVPTDQGYRFYVDSLMEVPALEESEKKLIDFNFENYPLEVENLLRLTCTLLSDMTNQIALATFPQLSNAVLERLHIVQLPGSRILVIISIKNGPVNTISLEASAEFTGDQIDSVQQLFNERLVGLKFSEIKKTFGERVQDFSSSLRPIVRLFIGSLDRIFSDVQSAEKVVIAGAKNILRHPEFISHEQFESIVELIENKDVIVHILDRTSETEQNGLSISIGTENKARGFSEYSLISKKYRVGDIVGSLGIVGPKRMQYSRSIASVVYLAEHLARELKDSKF